MKMKRKVALIGAGGRANAYLMHGAKEGFDLVALADPNPVNRRTFLGLNNLLGMVAEYDCYHTMLENHPEIDGAIITTPNYLHVAPAIECLSRRIAIALEKPIAESPESCKAILEAKRKYKGRVLVGFVLRSAPFYQKAKEWLDEGRIGQIVSIQADEIPHILTTSVMFRSDWRRFTRFSGGSMNEKCCHDIDLFNWLVPGKPVAISSIAGVKTLAPNPAFPERCIDCGYTSECCYYLPPSRYDHPDMVNKANDGLLYKFTRDNSACIYNNGHDIYDHQQVLIEYEDHVTVAFTMDFSGKGKACGRTIKIMGTEGAIYGKLEEHTIRVQDKRSDREEICNLLHDGSGHGGADTSHAREFVRLMEDPSFRPQASVEAGYLSSLMCFQADEAARQKKRIGLNDIVRFAQGDIPEGFVISGTGKAV